ncbi:MAG: hypothetical protein J7K98_02080 [Candidatus Aenigmarchaeota archaeon]|nr:hypothetical protein [Candidatus Aenigmarchaeota archaeon]
MFESYEKRYAFLQLLKEKGFYVRMHAYEYLLGKDGKIVGVLLLEPANNRVEIFFSPILSSTERKRVEKEIRNVIRKIQN